MDSRIALEVGYELDFKNCSFIIDREIGRGGSCIVYDAHYFDNLHIKQFVRIKECYPFTISASRLNDGTIQVEDGEDAFLFGKKTLRDAYLFNTQLFNEGSTGTEIINVNNIYELNNTVYIVYPYFNVKELNINNLANLEDVIFVARSVAQVISTIHKHGFLYLDLKPSNILVFGGINKGIQLFDFDTLLPIKRQDTDVFRVSFSKGFSSLEQRKGDIANIGIWSDVYSVGALLYYMVFGKEPGVVYGDEDDFNGFTAAKYDFDEYPETLKKQLSDFWKQTLPSYYLDRYSDMAEVVGALEQMEKLANRDCPFIISAHLLNDNWFIGRKNELIKIEKWFKSDSPICYICGLPGMGKSTFVKEFLNRNSLKYDYLLYTYFSESIKRTIVSDNQVRIYSVSKSSEENDDEYFERKLSILSRICKDSKVILVIDEYEGEIDSSLHRLIDAGLRIIVISERISALESTCNITIEKLDDAESIILFEHHLNRKVIEDEINAVDDIISSVDGHVYAIESCAKQIRYSLLTVGEACELSKRLGFTGIAEEKIPFFKDNVETKQTVRCFFENLFSIENQSDSMRMMMRIISLFGKEGIIRDRLKSYLGIKNWDELNELIEKGWVVEEEHKLRVHSINREIIKGWNWNDYEVKEMNRILCLLYRELSLITEADDLSKNDVKWLERTRKKSEENPYFKKIIIGYLDKKSDMAFSLKMKDRIQIPFEKQKADTHEIWKCLYYDLKLIYGIQDVHVLNEIEWFVLLASKVADILPREYVDISLNLYERLSRVKRPTYRGKLSIGEKKLQKFLDYGDIDKAAALLEELKPKKSDLFKLDMSYYNALYYDEICSPYYDYKLDGQYFTDNKDHDYRKLIESNEKALFYYTLEHLMTGRYSFVQCYIARAQLYLRAYSGESQDRTRIEKAIKKAAKMVEKYCQDSSREYYSLLLTKAWYSTFVQPDEKVVGEIENQVRNIASKKIVSKLDYIDECLIPFANMYCELNDIKLTCTRLDEAIDICVSFSDFVPYQKKKEELEQHLQEVLELG